MMRRAILMCAGEYEPIPIPVGEKNKSLRFAEAFDNATEKSGKEKTCAAAAETALSAQKAVHGRANEADPEACGPVLVPEADPEAGSPLVVAVDGGLARLIAQDIVPDIVLGDFDSLDNKYRPYLERFGALHPDRLFRLPCEKDDTDTVYAARTCMELGCRELLFYGALGGRLDHTFANVQTLVWLKKQGADGYLIGEKTLVAVIGAETVLLPAQYEGTFSLFALDTEVSGVTLEGMKYPLSEGTITNSFPIGVSNEIHPETVTGTARGRAAVTVRSGMALMILETSAGAGRGARAGRAGSSGIQDPSTMERIPL